MKTQNRVEPSYFERQTNIESQITFLKFLTGGLVLAVLLALTGWYYAQRSGDAVRPIVVGVDDNGKWHIQPGDTVYQPSEQLFKYFLTSFVTAYYGKERATIKKDFEHALYFLDSRLSDALVQAERKTQSIPKFLSDQSVEDTIIRVSNIVLEDTVGPVYRADVGYKRIAVRDYREVSAENHLARLSFVMKRPVPAELIPLNPLGLVIINIADSGPEQAK
jgi:type IV secretory pathway TrbF-like protein